MPQLGVIVFHTVSLALVGQRLVVARIRGATYLAFRPAITISDPNGNRITLDWAGIILSRAEQKIAISDAPVTVNDGVLEVM